MYKVVDEQDIRDYCYHHPLSRPNVNVVKLIVVIVMAECGMYIISYLAYQHIGISLRCCYNLINFLAILSFGNHLCKTIVLLYQKYASDETRRKCHCMPSCSEYALLALDKYFWPKALWKIFKRLTYTCCLPGYKVDYP